MIRNKSVRMKEMEQDDKEREAIKVLTSLMSGGGFVINPSN